jgi:HNH endonuclease/EVE domain
MTAWIFQGNPDRFDIDGYLAFAPDRITWLVNQYRKAIHPGDQVFLWRARGRGTAGPAGVVAECLVVSRVMEMEDEPSSIQFWRGSGEAGPKPRVWLKVVRVAARLLDRDVIGDTPGLEAIGPIGFGNATNFKLGEEETREWIARPGCKTSIGEMWTGARRNENRCLEPAQKRTFGAGFIRVPGTGICLNRIWHDRTIARTEERARAELDEQAAILEQDSLDRLLEHYRQRTGVRKSLPRRSQATAFVFERDPYVVAISRVRAGFRCELPGCQTPSFVTDAGARYCEIHHIVPLADGGVDATENAACVCPNHHRELHVGKSRKELTQKLINIRKSVA